jgi:hypothetical protein
MRAAIGSFCRLKVGALRCIVVAMASWAHLLWLAIKS